MAETATSNFLRIAPNVRLGNDAKVHCFANLYGCSVGDESRVGAFVEIQKGATIGARCKISSHTFICEGVTIEDDVFIGHGVVFINDHDPRATANGHMQTEADWHVRPTRVCRGASIGSGAVIRGDITIGAGALVGAGAIVTHDVAPNTVVVGNPARFLRMRDPCESALTNGHAAGAAHVPCEQGVPFLDLKAQYAQIRDEIAAALIEVAESACYVLGPRVEAFEKSFAECVAARHCVAVNSGTSALHLALLAAGVGPGDEVIVPAMTFIATAWAVRYVGAKPVFADVDPTTYTLDPEQVERRVSPHTRAVLPVHLYGQPADLTALGEIAQRYGIALVEDAAQAHAATYRGRPVGAFGQFGCFSFYPGKNLGAYGEGGAVVTNDDAAAHRMRALRDHAQRQRYCHEELGFNYRMDAFQGAVLGIKLKYLDEWTAARQRIAARYMESLTDLPLQLPCTAADRRHVWHLFVALHPERDRIRAALEERNIQTGLHYPVPLHLQPAFRDLGHVEGDFPVAERIGRECFSLPIFPEMTTRQQDQVIDALAQAIE